MQRMKELTYTRWIATIKPLSKERVMCECDNELNMSDHKVIYKGASDETLCFSCAVKRAGLGNFIETEVEHINSWQSCSECGR